MASLLNPVPNCTRKEAQEALKHAQQGQMTRGSDYEHLKHLIDTTADNAIHIVANEKIV
ncbi:MAG: hypothetical protein WC774_01760 [Candidatus Gracilibacteria bacterium]